VRLVVAPDPEAALVAVEFWFAAGAADEPATAPGVAHLTEHLLVRGLQRADPVLVDAGATFDGRTTLDACRVGAEVRPGDVERVLRAGAEILARPVREDDVAIERRVIRSELRGGRRLRLLAGDAQRRAAFFGAEDPYARNVAGDPDRVAALTAADVEGFRAAMHRRDTLILSVAGPVDPETVAAQTEALAWDLPGARAASEWSPAEAPTRAPGACVVVPGPPAGHPHAPLAEIWVEACAKRLRQGWASAWAGRRAGLLILGRTGGADEAIEAGRALARDGIDGRELAAARAAALRGEHDWARTRACELGEAEAVAGDAEAFNRRLERLRAATRGDVDAFARTIDWSRAGTTDVPLARRGGTRPILRSWPNSTWSSATDALERLLSGPLGPVQTELRERRGLAYSMHAYSVRDRKLVLAVGAAPEVRRETEEALDHVLARLAREVTPAEARRAVAAEALARLVRRTAAEQAASGVVDPDPIEAGAALVEAARRILGRAPEGASTSEEP